MILPVIDIVNWLASWATHYWLFNWWLLRLLMMTTLFCRNDIGIDPVLLLILFYWYRMTVILTAWLTAVLTVLTIDWWHYWWPSSGIRCYWYWYYCGMCIDDYDYCYWRLIVWCYSDQTETIDIVVVLLLLKVFIIIVDCSVVLLLWWLPVQYGIDDDSDWLLLTVFWPIVWRWLLIYCCYCYSHWWWLTIDGIDQ